MLEVPAPIRAYLENVVRRTWSRGDPQSVIDALPARMPPGVVRMLVSGGPYGWLVEARLDEIDGRIALEVLEDDRMSGPSHYRVWEDGTGEALPTERSAHSAPDDPEAAERALREFQAHNQYVQEVLAQRGFRCELR